MGPVVSPANSDNVLQPGEEGGEGGGEVEALHVDDLLLAGEGEAEHPEGGRGVGRVGPRVSELLHVRPQVGSGRAEAQDSHNLNIALVNLFVEEAVRITRPPRLLRLPPKTSKPTTQR